MGSWGYACCPSCDDHPPLISTLSWRKFEFYCLECGGHFGFLQPVSDRSDEAAARHAALQGEWDEHVGPYLIVQGREDRASPTMLAEHAAAILWLGRRVRVPF